jgi:hypothetical protein
VPQFGWRNEGESYSDSIGNVIQPEIRVITGVTYVPTSAIFQPEATVTITYRTSLGDNNVSFTTTLDKKYSFDPEYASMMLPNSGVFSITSPTGVVLLEQQGSVYTDINLITGSKTKVGTIDYDQKEITITTDHSSFVSTTSGVSLYCKSAMTYVGDDACSTIVFRTPGSPVTSGSLSVSATCTDGTLLTGTSDFDGVISGTGITGDIRFITGIVNLQFGTYVTDNASAQSQSWYNANNVVGSNVWKPYFVVASTIMVSCVVESYIPLDSDLLGLDPVRLPLDGKVPIFRDGNIVLIHNTLSTTIPDNPALAGETYSTGRTNLSLIELYDQNSVYIPDTNYTVDLDAGTVTMNSPLNLSTVSYTPTQPLVIMHRIEDMLLASDVQLTGYMAFTSPLTHNYSASNSYVSTVLPIGDLQSGVYNEFEQDSWTEVWSDELIGSEPIASYDLINFPIIVENDSATQERFALIFQNTTNVMVVGESLGVLSDGSSTTWSIGSNIAPINPITGNAYFTILAEGWGAGWSTGNVFRFNTRAANFPIWFIRTTLQGPAVGSSDSYSCQIRGDSS